MKDKEGKMGRKKEKEKELLRILFDDIEYWIDDFLARHIKVNRVRYGDSYFCYHLTFPDGGRGELSCEMKPASNTIELNLKAWNLNVLSATITFRRKNGEIVGARVEEIVETTELPTVVEYLKRKLIELLEEFEDEYEFTLCEEEIEEEEIEVDFIPDDDDDYVDDYYPIAGRNSIGFTTSMLDDGLMLDDDACSRDYLVTFKIK